ncbi:Uncharacterized protein TCM_003357 [Theobroma cacao]|uniref:Uncharacterized protein n=1 Tax=Theobroma cacao TaxID=3641 RepID=A0A061DVU8_THECC|nr:Uncharacterized protein TCM_003357 [Theobroma cacao]
MRCSAMIEVAFPLDIIKSHDGQLEKNQIMLMVTVGRETNHARVEAMGQESESSSGVISQWTASPRVFSNSWHHNTAANAHNPSRSQLSMVIYSYMFIISFRLPSLGLNNISDLCGLH